MEYLKLLMMVAWSLYSLLTTLGLNIVLLGACAVLVTYAIYMRLYDQCGSVIKPVKCEDTQRALPQVVSKAVFEDIVIELQSVTRWFDLGLQLKVPAQYLHQLKSQQVCIELKRIEVLQEWTRMDPNPSWIQIINALIQIDEKKLAHHIALKYGVSMKPNDTKSFINKKCVPTMLELKKELRGILNWFELGLHMGISETRLKGIEERNHWNNIEGCKEDMLMEWLSNSEQEWQDVIGALQEMRKIDLAEYLANKYNVLSREHTALNADIHGDHSATPLPSDIYPLLHLVFFSFLSTYFPGGYSIITSSLLHLTFNISIPIWTSLCAVILIIIGFGWLLSTSSLRSSQDKLYDHNNDDNEIAYKDLVHDLREIRDWWLFGKTVNLSQTQLLTIYQEGRTINECRAHMIEMWLKLEKPTWSKVLSSLFKCGMPAVGWKLAAKHGQPITQKMIRLAKTFQAIEHLHLEGDNNHDAIHKSATCPSGLMDGLQEVSVKDLLSELSEATSSWFELGAFLDIPESKLREIFDDYANMGVEDCMIEMILTWRQLTVPTWKAIIIALTGIEMPKLAKRIAGKYDQPYPESLQRAVAQSQSERTRLDLQQDPNSATSTVSEEDKIVSEKILSGGISLDQMLTGLEDVTVRWFMLGIFLGIDDATLKAIRENKKTVEKCKVEMLIKWSNRENPTWEKLILALLDIDETTVAVNIATKYRVPLPQSVVDKLQGKVSTEELRVLEVVQTEICESSITISSEKLECGQLSLQQLANELKDVTEWFHFGVCLHVSTSKLQSIQRNYGRQGTERCKIEMLLYWLQQKLRSWLEVVGALMKMRMRTLAQKIAANYGVPLPMNDVFDSEVQETSDHDQLLEELQSVKTDLEKEKEMNHAEINQLKFELEKERQELQKAMVTVNKMEEFERQFNEFGPAAKVGMKAGIVAGGVTGFIIDGVSSLARSLIEGDN